MLDRISEDLRRSPWKSIDPGGTPRGEVAKDHQHHRKVPIDLLHPSSGVCQNHDVSSVASDIHMGCTEGIQMFILLMMEILVRNMTQAKAPTQDKLTLKGQSLHVEFGVF
jgi:hypothetical protein